MLSHQTSHQSESGDSGVLVGIAGLGIKKGVQGPRGIWGGVERVGLRLGKVTISVAMLHLGMAAK